MSSDFFARFIAVGHKSQLCITVRDMISGANIKNEDVDEDVGMYSCEAEAGR